MKFVSRLNEEAKSELIEIMKKSQVHRIRVRAHSILLSDRGWKLDEIAEICWVGRDTVSGWLDRWEERSYGGLKDAPKSGRPKKLSAEEEEQVLEFLAEEPRSLKQAQGKLQESRGKVVSTWTVKRIAKQAKLGWKRLRKSLKFKRNQRKFEDAQAEIEQLELYHAWGGLDLFYFDATGFSLTPQLPYAWQPIGQSWALPAQRSPQLNLLGFFNTDNEFHPFLFEGSVDSQQIISCFDHFVTTIRQPTVVVIDNASTHTSHAFKARLLDWAQKGLFVKYLPPYSPELNRIEILWRFIKYQWLPFDAYFSFLHLKQALSSVIDGIGSKYRISFA